MDHWKFVIAQAEKHLGLQTKWTSFVQEHQYQISNVTSSKIKIKRLSGGKDADVTRHMVNKAVSVLSEQKIIRHGQLLKNVANECAIIQLHPNFRYDSKSKSIIWTEFNHQLSKASVEELVKEAPDDVFEKIITAVNARRYQEMFRKNLMKVYNKRCVVTDCNIEDLLEAAHISKHSISRKNDTTNGLLLRADLHLLFDKALLKINPFDLKVHISNTIENSEYQNYHGRKINDRIDGKSPDKKLLELIWNN